MKNVPGSKSKISSGSADHAAILNSLPDEVSEVASSLLPEDLEILAYLIACPSQTRASTHHSNKSNKKVQVEASCSKPSPSLCNKSVSFQLSDDLCKSSVDVQLRKPALFCCNCFQCYTSYWSRWDASPNRGKIDEAIALYEDHIDRKSKKPNKGSSDSKGEKRHEGKGRGRKSHKEHKQKELNASAKVEKEKSSRPTINDSVAKDDHCSELLLLAEKKALGNELVLQQEQKQLFNQENSSLTSDVDGLNATGINQQEKASSFLKSPPRSNGKTQGSKEKLVMKEIKVKMSRVAPFVGEGAMADQNDNTCLDSSDLDSDTDDSTTLHRGRKLMSFVASRLWGFWDRRVQNKAVDVY